MLSLLSKRTSTALRSKSGLFSALRHYQRTSTDDPAALGIGDVGKLYHIPLETVQSLNFSVIAPSKIKKQIDTLNECSLLCREQFLEVAHCLAAARPSFPAIRVVLWGRFGTGKTLTLAQTVHLAYNQKWVIVNVRDVMDFTRQVKDVQMSSHTQGRIDLPEHSVAFLQHFKQQNHHLWSKIGDAARTERVYEWSKTERTEADQPITAVVDLGIASPFAANDCVAVLWRELRRAASAGGFKLLVAMDAANSLYGKTLIKKADRTFAKPDEISLIVQLKKFLADSWSNGAVVMVADKREIADAYDTLSVPMDTPIELFTEEGFEDIDPFIPVETQLYTSAEAEALHEYYVDKHWLVTDAAREKAGFRQMYHLAAYNPYHFERLCAFN